MRLRRLASACIFASLLVLMSSCLEPLDVIPHPVASFTRSPDSGEAPLSVLFDGTASAVPGGNIVTYEWDFGDGQTAAGPTVEHLYVTAGLFDVVLTVQDSQGGADSATSSVWVLAPSRPLVVVDWALQANDNIFMPWVVVGHATNVSSRALSYASVDAQFYDAAGILLASWFDNVTSLPAGATWEFNVYCIDSELCPRVHHATVSVGACW